MIFLGIDPGTRVTGYGLVRRNARGQLELIDYGCIKPPPKEPLSKRSLIIFEAVEELLDHHQPTALAVETQYVHKNVQSAIKLGIIRGNVILAATRRDIPIYEYAPSRAKQAVVGKGHASKEQVKRMVQVLLALPQPPTPEDASDALAIAICHAQSFQATHPLGALI